MSFLSTAFLWAIPLVSVPVIIHMFHRRRQEVIRWGAMKFLMEGASRRRRIWRVDDLLLMLLRALAVLVIVLALAQPMITAGWLGSPAGREIILVIDNSMSTGRTVEGRPQWVALRQRADDLLAELGEGDTVRIMLTAGGPQWLTPQPVPLDGESRLQLQQRIARLQPTLAASDLLSCMQSAVQVEPEPDSLARYIVLVTDGAAHGWSADATLAWQNLRLSLDDVELPTNINAILPTAPEAVGNLSLEAIDANHTVVGTGEPFTLTAQLKNVGSVPTSPAVLEWECDGQPLGVSSVESLGPGQTTGVPFEHTLAAPGAYQLRCTADHTDELSLDNAGTLVVEVVQQVPILIVGRDNELDPSRSDTHYLEAALGRRSAMDDTGNWHSVFDPTIVPFDGLQDVDLAEFHCVVLSNVPPLSGPVIERLREYVHNGGGLWIALGPRTEIESFNEHWFAQGAGLSPLAVSEAIGDVTNRDEFVSIHPPGGDHPATQLLGDTERLDIDEARICRRFRFEQDDAANRVSVLLETGSGEPLAIEKYSGRGRAIVLAVPLGIGWSNLPVCHAYVAMIHEWLWYLGRPSFAVRNLQPGEPIVVTSAGNTETDATLENSESASTTDSGAVIETPAGESLPLVAQASGKQITYRFARTRLPGDYIVERKAAVADAKHEQTRIPFTVLRDPRESNLAPLTAEQKKLLETAGSVQFVSNPFHTAQAGTARTYRHPFWNHLLIAALLFMAAELLLAGWSAHRRYAADPRFVSSNPS